MRVPGGNRYGSAGAVFTRIRRGILVAAGGRPGRLFRLRGDGRPDRSFGTRGSVRVPVRDSTDILRQGRGILVSGRARIVRLRRTGRLDPTFAVDGVLYSPAVGEDMLIDHLGRIVSSRGIWRPRKSYDEESGNFGYSESGSFALARILP